MGKLIYLMTTSLDGFAADNDGNFNWAKPTEEVHNFVNDQLRNVGTILMGRNLYETMRVWDEIPIEGTGGAMDGPSPAMNDYANIWHNANKIIYSTTLTKPEIANTALERSFDPQAIKRLTAVSEMDFDIGGPHLAAQAMAANIIDEYHQIIVPVTIGGGLPMWPKDVKLNLILTDMRKFENGFVHLHYRKV